MKEQLDRYDAYDFVSLAKTHFYNSIKAVITLQLEHNFVEKGGEWTVHNIQEVKNDILEILEESKNYEYEAPDGYLYTYDFKDLAKEQLADNFGDAFWCLIEGEK